MGKDMREAIELVIGSIILGIFLTICFMSAIAFMHWVI